jgi:hypothetical protein
LNELLGATWLTTSQNLLPAQYPGWSLDHLLGQKNCSQNLALTA